MDSTTSFQEQLDRSGVLCYTNMGVSMMPLLRERRDVMIITKRPPGQLKKYEAVLFRRRGIHGRGEYVLHRILQVNPDGTYWIVGDNCTDGETVRDEDIMGVLTGVQRDGKPLRFSSLKYRLYVFFWAKCWPARIFIQKHYRRCRGYAYWIYRQISRRIFRRKG